METERRIVSVLFADLVGFTSLSESLDAEDVLTVQDAYFDTVRDTVGRYRGVLEKFIGDAAVAVFGVPRTEDDDAERAVAAGLALAAAVDHLGARLGLEADALRLRVGINTGEALVTTGTADRGPVTGDTVNVAARLQGAAPPGRVLVSGETALAVGAAFELEESQSLQLKGKAVAVAASVVRAQRAARSREETMSGLQAPLLGREAELALLLDAVGRAREGAGELILVVAPPGTGKSRLVDELERALPGDVALRRIRARADALAPYEPIAQLVAGGAGELRGEALAQKLEVGGLAHERAKVVAAGLELLLGSEEPAAEREPGGGQRARRGVRGLARRSRGAGRPSLRAVDRRGRALGGRRHDRLPAAGGRQARLGPAHRGHDSPLAPRAPVDRRGRQGAPAAAALTVRDRRPGLEPGGRRAPARARPAHRRALRRESPLRRGAPAHVDLGGTSRTRGVRLGADRGRVGCPAAGDGPGDLRGPDRRPTSRGARPHPPRVGRRPALSPLDARAARGPRA